MVDSWLLTLPGPVKQYGVVFKGLFNEMLDEVLDFYKYNLRRGGGRLFKAMRPSSHVSKLSHVSPRP